MLLSVVEAVTTSGETKPDDVAEIPAVETLEIEFKVGEKSESSDALGSDLAGHSTSVPYLSLEPIEVEARSPTYGTGSIEPPRRSAGIFSLALWLLGLLLVFAGLFSLSFGRKLEGITPQEFVYQLRYMNFVSAKRNVSINWGKKKDATWFVVMGIGSIVAGFMDYLFL